MQSMSKLLIGIGFVITAASSLVIFYATRFGVSGIQTSEATGIADIIWSISTNYRASYVNLFGLAILAFGIVSSFFGKKN